MLGGDMPINPTHTRGRRLGDRSHLPAFRRGIRGISHHLDLFGFAIFAPLRRASLSEAATACFCGCPALTISLIFEEMVFCEVPFLSGILLLPNSGEFRLDFCSNGRLLRRSPMLAHAGERIPRMRFVRNGIRSGTLSLRTFALPWEGEVFARQSLPALGSQLCHQAALLSVRLTGVRGIQCKTVSKPLRAQATAVSRSPQTRTSWGISFET